MSTKREGREHVHVLLPTVLMDKIRSRIGDLGPDKTAVIETILTQFWDVKKETTYKLTRK